MYKKKKGKCKWKGKKSIKSGRERADINKKREEMVKMTKEKEAKGKKEKEHSQNMYKCAEKIIRKWSKLPIVHMKE